MKQRFVIQQAQVGSGSLNLLGNKIGYSISKQGSIYVETTRCIRCIFDTFTWSVFI